MLKPTPRPHTEGRTSNAPRPHERRRAGAYPYYRLATFQPHLCTYRDSPKPYPTERAARAGAKAKGTYRITEIRENGVGPVVAEFTVN